MFVHLLASPDDIPQVASLQFQACADDPGFNAVFPKNQTNGSLAHLIEQFERMMETDGTAYMAIAKHALQGDIASYAIWHVFPRKDAERVEEEMLAEVGADAFPPDANVELGRELIGESIKKRIEVASKHFGMGEPYVYLAAVGTSPKYQKQGAASKLVEWSVKIADDKQIPMYVESTPVAVRFYQKFGFKECDRFYLRLPSNVEVDYFNTCMIRLPTHL